MTSSRRIADGAKFHHLREAYFDFIWDTESALKRETPIFSWSPNSFVVSNQCLRYVWSAAHSQSEALGFLLLSSFDSMISDVTCQQLCRGWKGLFLSDE